MVKDIEKEKELAAREAVKYLQPGMIVGLGTGSTAAYAIKLVGELVKQGLAIKAVVTSQATQKLALALNIPLVEPDTVNRIDITIDGADEFAPDMSLIKGGGGALLREKIVALLTAEEIIIADSSKQVEQLGKFHLPLAVVPYATGYVQARLNALHGTGRLRLKNGTPFVTDEGNYIIDADFGLIAQPAALARELKVIEGLVAHGLFINLAKKIIMGTGNAVVTFTAAGNSTIPKL